MNNITQQILQALPQAYGAMIFGFAFIAFGIIFTQMMKNNPNVKNPSAMAGFWLGMIGSMMIIGLVIL